MYYIVVILVLLVIDGFLSENECENNYIISDIAQVPELL